jgi:hypothetical protein
MVNWSRSVDHLQLSHKKYPMDGKLVAATSYNPIHGTYYICLMYNQITLCDLRSQVSKKKII